MSSTREGLAGSMTTRRVVVIVVVIAVAMLAIGALLAPSSGTGDPAGPEGSLGLRRLLDQMGIPVRDEGVPPAPPATFLLLADLRTRGQDRALLRWAAGGGRLVVADPASEVSSEVGIGPSPLLGSLFSDRALEPGCVAPEVAGVRDIEVDPLDAVLEPGRAGTVVCFPAGSGGYMASFSYGRGSVVLLGGRSALVNERLGRADDALFAVQVLRSGGPVAIGPAVPPGSEAGGQRSIWGALSGGARAAILGLVLALLALAVASGRRLGRPVEEEPVSPIPSGELVHASANLYRAARATSFAAAQLRRGAVARLARRIGAPPASPPSSVVPRVAELTGERSGEVERLLDGPEPRSDDELIALARDLEDLMLRIEGDDRRPDPTRVVAGHGAAGGPSM